MPHMVIFRSAEGKPGYHQAESLDEAVRFVEHLRNQEHVPDARIFRMQEVPIEFKTYVKVELAPVQDEAGAVPSAPMAPASVPSAPVAPASPVASPVAAASPVPAPEADKPALDKGDEVVVDPVPAGQAGAATRFGRFNRG